MRGARVWFELSEVEIAAWVNLPHLDAITSERFIAAALRGSVSAAEVIRRRAARAA